MPKFAISAPMFIKVTGVEGETLAKVKKFLARDDVKSHLPVFAGNIDHGRLSFIELIGSKHDEEYGTHTLDFKVHPFFRSWKKNPDEFTKRFCPMGLISDFFYMNFHYFENPT